MNRGLGLRVWGGVILLAASVEAEPAAPSPKITSIYPAAVTPGGTVDALIRGTALAGARGLVFSGGGVAASEFRVEKGESEKQELLRVRLAVDGAAASGRREFRVLAASGISNALPLEVAADPVLDEKDAAGPLQHFPVLINGTIGEPGEADAFWIEAAAGEVLSFEAVPAVPGLDPSLSLWEPSGSWFDARRLNRIAGNDEPLYFPGLSLDAHLTHRFTRAGKYVLKLQAFSGQGTGDYVYRLRIFPGPAPDPDLHPRIKTDWEERQFTRRLGPDRLADLARRGGSMPKTGPRAGPGEIFHAVPEGAGEPPLAAAPAWIEGRIAKAGEAHVIRLRVDKAQELAIEIETPHATMPRFNPIVRLMDPGGGEMVTSLYTKLNNNGLYMMKMIQAKTTFSLQAPGEYTLQIRDITTDCAGPDFDYRVLVRPQIPHAGKIEVAEDRINLEAGGAQPLTISVDREEGFAGYVTASVEGLPPGVTAVPALENPPERPPLPNGGRLERYTAKEQRLSLVLAAAEDAAPTELPAKLRVVVRVSTDGRISAPIAEREIPLMVLPRRPS
jgi:hypothetical protein